MPWDIIANCIDVGTKQRGGERSAWSLSVCQTLCGAKHIRSRDLGFALEAGVNPSKGEGRQGMERCSPSIWNLGITLAKSLAELVNPEKSLVATIC